MQGSRSRLAARRRQRRRVTGRFMTRCHATSWSLARGMVRARGCGRTRGRQSWRPGEASADWQRPGSEGPGVDNCCGCIQDKDKECTMRFSHRQSTRSALQASLPAPVTAYEARPRRQTNSLQQ